MNCTTINIHSYACNIVILLKLIKICKKQTKKNSNGKKTRKVGISGLIDHMTLTVKSKRRQNGGAACIATVE